VRCRFHGFKRKGWQNSICKPRGFHSGDRTKVPVAASPKKLGKRNPPNRRIVRLGPPWLGELSSRLEIPTSQSQGCLRSTWTACSPLPLSVASLLARGYRSLRSQQATVSKRQQAAAVQESPRHATCCPRRDLLRTMPFYVSVILARLPGKFHACQTDRNLSDPQLSFVMIFMHLS
jgi:hypothetical protein